MTMGRPLEGLTDSSEDSGGQQES